MKLLVDMEKNIVYFIINIILRNTIYNYYFRELGEKVYI
jgi:hypothetical protein